MPPVCTKKFLGALGAKTRSGQGFIPRPDLDSAPATVISVQIHILYLLFTSRVILPALFLRQAAAIWATSAASEKQSLINSTHRDDPCAELVLCNRAR